MAGPEKESALRSPGTRIDLQDGAHAVLLVLQHVLGLQFLGKFQRSGELFVHLRFLCFTGLLEFQQYFEVLHGGLDPGICLGPRLKP